MTTKGKTKFVEMLKNLKKLSPTRQKYWLGKIKSLRESSLAKELGDEPDSRAQELQTKLTALINKKFGVGGWKKAFDAYDSNKDGSVNAAELDKLLSDAGVGNAFTRSFWVAGVLEKLDKNKNAKISYDELSAVIVSQTPSATKPASTAKSLSSQPSSSKIIQMPVQTIVGSASKSWFDETAEWANDIYERKISGLDLTVANTLDKIYNTVADEAVKIPGKAGEAVGQFTGQAAKQFSGLEDLWPWMMGAAILVSVAIYASRR